MERVDDLMRRVVALETRLNSVEQAQQNHHRENTARLTTIEANQGKIADDVERRFDKIDTLLNKIDGALIVAKWISRVMWPAVLAALGWVAHKIFIASPAP